MEKHTKKDILMAVRTVAENGGVDFGEVTVDEVIAYIDTTITQIETKAIKAKERAEKIKAEGDSLKDAIEAALNENYQTIDQIIDLINVEDVTRGKITSRMTKLIKEGKAHKDFVKRESDGHKIMAYAAGPAPVEEEEVVE